MSDFLLRTPAQTPNCLTISTIAIPYSRLKIHVIIARTRPSKDHHMVQGSRSV